MLLGWTDNYPWVVLSALNYGQLKEVILLAALPVFLPLSTRGPSGVYVGEGPFFILSWLPRDMKGSSIFLTLINNIQLNREAAISVTLGNTFHTPPEEEKQSASSDSLEIRIHTHLLLLGCWSEDRGRCLEFIQL